MYVGHEATENGKQLAVGGQRSEVSGRQSAVSCRQRSAVGCPGEILDEIQGIWTEIQARI